MKKIIFSLMVVLLFTSCVKESRSVHTSMIITDKNDTIITYGGTLYFFENGEIKLSDSKE